jgi:hypothetical protein
MTQLQQVRSTVTNRKKKSSYRHLGKSNSLLSSNGFTSGPNKRESSLLGDLHVDKLYLENLLLNPGIGGKPFRFFFIFPYLIHLQVES